MSILSILPSRRCLPATKDNELYVAVRLSAPKLALQQRQPMAISLAIDTSSSMGAETQIRRPGHMFGNLTKLDVVKFALSKLVENLSEKDSLTLTTFSSSAELLSRYEMTPEGRSRSLEMISSLRAYGSTALADGLVTAINAQPNDGRIKRTMLFTDGEANIGARSLTEIQRYMQLRCGFEERGISTFGVGSTYEGELLGALAQGGGAHYYLDNEERIPVAFGTELGTLASLYARNVRLTIRPSKNVESLEMLNGLRFESLDSNASCDSKCLDIYCDDLYSEQKYDVVLKLKLKRRAKPIKNSVPILTAEGSLKDLATSGTLNFSERLELTLGSARSADKADDLAVMSAVAMQVTAKAQRDAVESAKRGDLGGARRYLLQASDQASKWGREDLARVSIGSAGGYSSQAMYSQVGSKMGPSLMRTLDRQTAGTGGAVVGGVDVDFLVSNETQRKMASAFSITKAPDAAGADDMPDVNSMVTS